MKQFKEEHENIVHTRLTQKQTVLQQYTRENIGLTNSYQKLQQKLENQMINKFQHMKKTSPAIVFPLHSFLSLLGVVLLIIMVQWHYVEVKQVFRSFTESIYRTNQQIKKQIMLSNEYIDNLWIAHHDLYIKQKDSLYMKTISKFNQIYLDDNFLTLLSFKKHNLKYLYMWNMGINDTFISRIMSQQWFDNIKVLQLNDNNLTDLSIQHFLIKQRKSLTWLNLKNNQITQKGIIKLIKNNYMLQNLKYINYEGNPIKDIYKIHYMMSQMLPTVSIAIDQTKTRSSNYR